MVGHPTASSYVPARDAWLSEKDSGIKVPVYIADPLPDQAPTSSMPGAVVDMKLNESCQCLVEIELRIKREAQSALSLDISDPFFCYDNFMTCKAAGIENSPYVRVVDEHLHRVLQPRAIDMELYVANNDTTQMTLVLVPLVGPVSFFDYIHRAIDSAMVVHSNPHECIRAILVTECEPRAARFYFHSLQWLKWRPKHSDSIADHLKSLIGTDASRRYLCRHGALRKHVTRLENAGFMIKRGPNNQPPTRGSQQTCSF